MSKFRLVVKVELEEISDDQEETGIISSIDHGSMRLITNEEACSIDSVEHAVLSVSHHEIRRALSAHLAAMSKKKAIEVGNRSIPDENNTLYAVEGEAGRYEFTTHNIILENGTIFNTATDFFPLLTGKEKFKTAGFKEVALVHGCIEQSYNKTVDLLNRIRHQPAATPARTLCHYAILEGEKINHYLSEKSATILASNGFDSAGQPSSADEYPVMPIIKASGDKLKNIQQALHECACDDISSAELQSNHLPYEDISKTAIISIDDVGVKKQKEHRKVHLQSGGKIKKRVQNTVAHIQYVDKVYVLTGNSLFNVLTFILAFLLNNGLLKHHLLFFTDGQRSLKSTIFSFFKWRHCTLILDWYHITKKIKELLSMGLKNRIFKVEVAKMLTHLLWNGCVDRAIEYILTIDEKEIKNKKILEDLIGYFERNRQHIPCYAMRKELGLRNSSNRVEKMNDNLVAERQKNNGMSWSVSGSTSLASITALKKNNEHLNWFSKKEITFKLSA